MIIRACPFVLVVSALLCPVAFADTLDKSVVKITTVAKPADYNQPWSMRWQKAINGSGFILPGRRIMTNAHVVSDQIFIQVLKAGDTKKYTATVEYVAHDCEIAILKVKDPEFFAGTVPVRFGKLPYQREKVAAFGFPTGGNELSITEGIVSRIEVRGYTHSKRSLLTIQTDAAINPGNSGGPVFMDGRVIGISFQTFRGGDAENIGYIVPVPVIDRFLKDIEDELYAGVPQVGIYWQKMENESLRRKYGLKKNDSGIMVTKVIYGSSAWKKLKAGDVITEIGGRAIANNGTIPFRKKERVAFSHVLVRHQVGDELSLRVLREGRSQVVSITLKVTVPLVSRPEYGVRPTYYIFGGIVFTRLTYNYMKLWSRWNDVPHWLRHFKSDVMPSEGRREVVVINQVLPHDINVGYHDIRDLVVNRINGRSIVRMADVVAAFEAPDGAYHVIDIDSHSSSWSRLVIDAGRAKKATAEVLERYRIESDRSEDLK